MPKRKNHLQSRFTPEFLNQLAVSQDGDPIATNIPQALDIFKNLLMVEAWAKTPEEASLLWALVPFAAPATEDLGYRFSCIKEPGATDGAAVNELSYLSYLIQSKNIAFINALKESSVDLNRINVLSMESFGRLAGEYLDNSWNFIHMAAQYATEEILFAALQDIMNHALNQKPDLMFQIANGNGCHGYPLTWAVAHHNFHMTEYLLRAFSERYQMLPEPLRLNAFEKLYTVFLDGQKQSLYELALKNKAPQAILKMLHKFGVPLISPMTDEHLNENYKNNIRSAVDISIDSPLTDVQRFCNYITSNGDPNTDILLKDENFWKAYLSELVPFYMHSFPLRAQKYRTMFLAASGTYEQKQEIINFNKSILASISVFLTTNENKLNQIEQANQAALINQLRIFAKKMSKIEFSGTPIKCAFWVLSDLAVYAYCAYCIHLMYEKNRQLYHDLRQDFPDETTTRKGSRRGSKCSWLRSEFMEGHEDNTELEEAYDECRSVYLGKVFSTFFLVLWGYFAGGLLIGSVREKNYKPFPLAFGSYSLAVLSLLLKGPFKLLTSAVGEYSPAINFADKQNLLARFKEIIRLIQKFFPSEIESNSTAQRILYPKNDEPANFSVVELITLSQKLNELVTRCFNFINYSCEKISLSDNLQREISSISDEDRRRSSCSSSTMLAFRRKESDSMQQSLLQDQNMIYQA